ncbi:MAG: methyltransferase domain-containing protein [Desulfuromonadales bacterium]|nr:methyltransferase domain-containing protein [Desulfuromonadales bacterium]
MNSETITDIPLLRGPVALSHHFIRRFLHEGDRAVDATCGNGSDTLLLAELVGSSGRVWAFDIQQAAIDRSFQRLTEAGLAERVKLIRAGHETLSGHVTDNISLVVFNLGYLPGGDRSIITNPETTAKALEMSHACLKPGGILAVTIYPGHDGGERERHVVESWSAGLDARAFHVWRMGQLNVPADAPYFILIQKAA